MKFALTACWVASLLILGVAAAPVPEPEAQANLLPTAAPKMLKRSVVPRGEKLQFAAAERLRRNQVNPVTMRNPVARFLDSRWFHKDNKPSPSPSHKPSGKPSPKPSPKSSWWKRNNDGKPSVKPSPKPSKSYRPSASPKYAVCPYSGKQADTDYCKEESTVDGCTAYSYDVSKSTLDLNKGNEFEEDGSVEFAYIPLSQYKGWGSAAQPDPSWTPVKAKIEFGSKQSTSSGEWGTDYVGESSLPWDAITELPEKGYCITWVKVSNFVQEYGIGGSGPVCFCPGKKL